MPARQFQDFALLLAFPLLLGASAAGWAQSPAIPPLPQELIEAPLQGRYVSGETFAIRFDRKGIVEHQGRNLNATGHWAEEDGLLCTLYQGQLVTDCWQTIKVSANCYHVMTKGLKTGPNHSLRPIPYRLHALVWRAAEPSTCEIPTG